MGDGRVYLPVTATALGRALAEGRFEPPLRGHAVTGRLAAGLAGDQEEHEYAAMQAAALDALLLLGPGDRPRRLVAAVDVAAWSVVEDPGEAASLVEVTVPVPLRRLASVHADTDDDAPLVAAAVRALHEEPQSTGTETAVQRCLDIDLGWYAVQEVDQLLGS
jgi:hypothetical protein